MIPRVRAVTCLSLVLLLSGCAGGDLDRQAQDLADVLTSATATSDARKAPPFGPPETATDATVVRIVDGDTMILHVGPGDDERVRLLRIDTPELSRAGQAAECLGREATDQLARFAPPGTAVLVATDVEVRDQYGRLLAHVWRADDDVWINGGMLATGYARVVTFPPNVAWDREVLALQAVAQDQGKGLWSAC